MNNVIILIKSHYCEYGSWIKLCLKWTIFGWDLKYNLMSLQLIKQQISSKASLVKAKQMMKFFKTGPG